MENFKVLMLIRKLCFSLTEIMKNDDLDIVAMFKIFVYQVYIKSTYF